MEGAVGTLGQTLAIVAYGLDVATHRAVVEGRPVARGAVGVAADALLLLLAGKEAFGTVVHARPLQEEVVLLTLWLGRGKATNHDDAGVKVGKVQQNFFFFV